MGIQVVYYYMHNKEIPRFPNKLKVIITSGLRRFISSKEIFPCSQFYFSNAIHIYKHLSHSDVFMMSRQLRL